MEEKPTTAFILSLIGGILIFLGTLYSIISDIVLGSIFASLGFLGFPPINIALVVALGLWGVVCGTLTVVGAVWIDSAEKHKVKKGSILVLVFSILSWIGANAGLVVGFVLGLVGAILGLTWKPPIKEKPPAPPMPP
jgi:hypothetical protein